MKPIYYRGHLIVATDNRISVMIPHAKPFVSEGRSLMLIPHGIEETRVLRNLGYEVTSPVMLAYNWAGTVPFEAQKITTAMITSHLRSYVLNGLGTGKTRAALFAYDHMREQAPNYGSMIVTAPLSTLRQTWMKEVTFNFPHLTTAVLHGSRAQRIKALEKGANVFIINHDGVETILDALLAHLPLIEFAVLDELSVYKNAKTKLWKDTHKFISSVPRVTGMTATPVTRDSLDSYGQIKMLTPKTLGGDSFTRFREKLQTKVAQFRWVDKMDSINRVFDLMQPAVRFTRDECYDIPECQYLDVTVDLTPDQQKAYDEIKAEGASERLNVTTANAADQINKLKQVVSGAVYDADRNVVDMPCKPREDELVRAIQQSEGKVIVFVPYKHSAAKVIEVVKAAGFSAAEVNGDVANGRREQIFTQFMQAKDPRVLVAHPQCMSHGLTLTEASTIVWWGPPDSLETYEQANGRITRAGQRLRQLIIRLVSCKLEQKIYRLLDTRADVQRELLDMFESQDHGDLL